MLSLSLLWIAADPCCREAPLYAQTRIEVVHVGAGEPIKLEKLDQFVWGGFEGARVVDGKVIAKVTSKPKFESTTSQIILTLGEGYEVDEIIAESDEAYIDLDQTPIDDGKVELTFPPDTPEGMYRIEVRAIKEGSRRAVKRLKVKIGGDGPAPPDIDDNKPTNDIERIVDNAMFEVRKGYASVFKQTAEAVGTGRIKTDADLLKFMVPISKTAREQAVAGIDGLIQDKLPRDGVNLKPEAPVFLLQISTAFERGLK